MFLILEIISVIYYFFVFFSNNESQEYQKKIFTLKQSPSDKCFDICGCAEPMDFGLGIIRKPFTSDEIKMSFQVFEFNSSMSSTKHPINSTSVTLPHHLSSNRDIIMIIHGYLSGFKASGWTMELTEDALDPKHGLNPIVIGVDWESGAGYLDYFQAAANTQTVGGCISHFIHELNKKFNVPHISFRLYGHSLGAHAAGFAGKRFENEELGLIFGIDPAGPGFDFISPNLRLDRDDANNTVCLYTDLILGIKDREICHLNILANGGIVQPGCPPTPKAVLDDMKIISQYFKSFPCSHSFGMKILQGLNRNGCQSVFHEYTAPFQKYYGPYHCGPNNEYCGVLDWPGPIIVSDYIKENRIKFNLITKENEPICTFRYDLRFEISEDSALLLSFVVSFESTNLGTKDYRSKDYRTGLYKPRHCYSWTVDSDRKLGRVKNLTVKQIVILPFKKLPGFKGFSVINLSNIDRRNTEESSYFCGMKTRYTNAISFSACRQPGLADELPCISDN